MISFRKSFFYVLIIVIYYKLPAIPDVIVDDYSLEVLSFIDQRLYFLIFPLIAIFLLKGDFKEFKKIFVLEKKNKILQITLASFLGYACFFISFLMFFYVISVAVNFTVPLSEKETYSFLDIIYLVIISAVFEEFFFRRILAYQFFNRYGLKKAVFYSAFLFTIIHDHNWFYIFIVGALLGYIYLKTRNIYITIGLHSLNNLSHIFLGDGTSVQPLILFLEDNKELKYFWWYYLIGFLMSITLTYYSFRYINRYYAKYNHR